MAQARRGPLVRRAPARRGVAAPFKAQAKEAHALSDILGDDHALAALEAALDPAGPAADVPLDEAALREAIADDRARLRAEAFALGRRLYAERPKDYRRRLLRYLRAAAAPAAAAA